MGREKNKSKSGMDRRKVLAGGKGTAIIVIALASVYSYLYVVLQLQDYSLLFGTAGLFIALVIVMYCTRDVDWIGEEVEGEERYHTQINNSSI